MKKENITLAYVNLDRPPNLEDALLPNTSPLLPNQSPLQKSQKAKGVNGTHLYLQQNANKDGHTKEQGGYYVLWILEL